MFLALVSLAAAAPLSPVGMQSSPLSIEVAGTFTADRTWLKADPATCSGDNCTAVRVDTEQGAQVDLRLLKFLGIYATAGHVREINSAAIYTGDGWKLEGGGKLTIPLGPRFGVDGWASLNASKTTNGYEPNTSDFERSKRITGTLGAAVHGGSIDDDVVGWAGADVALYSTDLTLLLGQSLDLELKPKIPASATAGFLLVSSPLGGPWSERGRVGVGASASVGYRTGLTLWLSGSY